MLNVGIIGLGFMGATHLAAWQAARADGVLCRVVAVADVKPERRAGNIRDVSGNLGTADTSRLAFDPADVKGYADPLELLRDERVHAVSICTPTDTHVELTLAAIRAGKHVLVEKPVSLRSGEVQRLLDAERAAPGIAVMPAMCMRFWPAWSWLKARIDAGTFGAVRSASFARLGTRPTWSPFYASIEKSGAALFDLHVHDADFIRWCFYEPTSVFSAGHLGADGGVHHVTTQYRGANGEAFVTAEAGWDQHAGFEFRMRYVVNFEHATADFDIRREHQVVLCRNGVPEVIELDRQRGYDHEVRYFANCAMKRQRPATVNLDDALAVTKLIEAEERSIRSGAIVQV